MTDFEQIGIIAENSQTQKKVMVIDDETLVVSQLSLLLMDNGYKPIPLTNSFEAMSLLLSERPDLLILDLNMPRLNGFEFLQIMRQSLSTKTLPVIVVSALTDPQSRLRAQELGVSRYLTKPYNTSELMKLIKELLGAKPDPLGPL